MGGRLIDADALKKRVSELIIPDWTRTLIRSWLDSAPTVDAVPVVRCRECIHRPKMPDNYVDGFDLEFPDHKCPCRCEDGFYSWYPADDWFCADGERRTDGK